MALLNKTVYLPHQLISYEDTQYFLQINSLGCVLYNEHSSVPLYQLHEPLLLVQGVAASTQQIHLVMIKANGDLCYTLINGSEQAQTTILAKLDVRSTRYRRLLLFPLGKTVHIFYAYAHQAIPDLWRIEHRFWNGKSWRSVNLGEVVHPREPLYDVVLDRKDNLHLVMLTFQGRQTVILSNRFNGTFYLWGNTSQAFQIMQEVSEMASIITPDNIHHIFWLAKNLNSKFELGWAYRTDIQEFTGNWLKAPAAIQTLNGPIKGLGAVEINGSLWLLVNAEVETLLLYKGDSWKQVVSNTPNHSHLSYIRKNNLSFYNTYWLEDSRDSRIPAFYQYLGLNFSSQTEPEPKPYVSCQPPVSYQSVTQTEDKIVQSSVATPIIPSAVIPQPQVEADKQQPPNQQAVPQTKATPQPEAIAQPEKITPEAVASPEKITPETIPSNEAKRQELTDANLQFAYDNYPDDLIPPAPEISDSTTPGCLAANIDQPVFAAKAKVTDIQSEPANETNVIETETLPSEPSDALPVFASLKVPAQRPETDVEKNLSDRAEDLNQALVPLIISSLDPYLKTKIEQIVFAIQREKEAEKAKEQKEQKKGFWARWFK